VYYPLFLTAAQEFNGIGVTGFRRRRLVWLHARPTATASIPQRPAGRGTGAR
jgi:hypothetical protein